MANKVPFSTRVMGLFAAQGIRAWMSTHDYRAYLYDPNMDPRFGTAEPRIYLFWHEYILVPLYLRGHCDIAMLLSRHRDAEILARVAGHMGFDCVRGSTTRGATAAMMEMRRLGKQSHIAITPDGPQGPRREMAQGAIYLASKSGMPIVPMGFGMSFPKRAKSWDQFAMPRPFSRIRCVLGAPITVAPDLSREGLEDSRLHVQRMMNELTLEAELWAEKGGTRAGDSAQRRLSRVRPMASPLPVEQQLQMPVGGEWRRSA
ncbi:MAG: lysophospholipid acyltransferase family protein [Bythopirellula sp.]|nr:lysophospholipid acyltransferase family protein [Bythopirellula sp.]